MKNIGVILCMVCGGVAPAWGVTGTQASATPDGQTVGNPSARTGLIDVNIPAQPLADALSRYALLTRQPALYDSDQAVGRTSFPVSGRYTAETALHLMLAGTGLVAQTVHTAAGDTFVLARASASPATATAETAASPSAGRPADAGLIQKRIWQALCADVATVPGQYSAVLRFRVDGDGRLIELRLLDPTGDARRDHALLAVLRRIQLDTPVHVLQPLTMAVLPDGPGVTPTCIAGKLQTVEGGHD